MRFRFAILLLLVAGTLRADVVKLKSGRTMSVVAVTSHGADVTLALRDGATITVPATTIGSIEHEAATAALCAASPYRCQDRAMLMHRAVLVHQRAGTTN